MQEMEKALQMNGCSKQTIRAASQSRQEHRENLEPTISKVLLPYIKVTTDWNSRVLHPLNIRTIFPVKQTICFTLKNPKGSIPLSAKKFTKYDVHFLRKGTPAKQTEELIST